MCPPFYVFVCERPSDEMRYIKPCCRCCCCYWLRVRRQNCARTQGNQISVCARLLRQRKLCRFGRCVCVCVADVQAKFNQRMRAHASPLYDALCPTTHSRQRAPPLLLRSANRKSARVRRSCTAQFANRLQGGSLLQCRHHYGRCSRKRITKQQQQQQQRRRQPKRHNNKTIGLRPAAACEPRRCLAKSGCRRFVCVFCYSRDSKPQTRHLGRVANEPPFVTRASGFLRRRRWCSRQTMQEDGNEIFESLLGGDVRKMIVADTRVRLANLRCMHVSPRKCLRVSRGGSTQLVRARRCAAPINHARSSS